MTPWRYHDTEAVVLLWQQAERPGYVPVKRTACQRDQERLRTPTPSQPNSWAQSPTSLPPPLRATHPQAFQTAPRPWEQLNISHSSFSHTHTLLNLLLNQLFVPKIQTLM
ncbi:hypothetical protein XENOCAPTIV_007745 [Xenoophorus captivus]|uniref:Uncharacterized protein n=3 Tax=Goodeidae TaxID=28758 RepID=A0ABV0S1M5_9TELE|nr:hypothetical protein [Ataeniobius toweri]